MTRSKLTRLAPYLWPALKAAPALFGPLVVTATIIWAKLEYAAAHQQEVANSPATISEAASDPAIAGTFANCALIAEALLACGIWGLFKLLLGLIDGGLSPSESARSWSRRALIFCAACQYLGVIGLVLLSEWPSHTNSNVHMVGSYLLFFGHSVGIAVCGGLCAFLLRHGDVAGYIGRVHVAAAIWVMASALLFLALFILKDTPLPIERYWLLLSFTSVEMILSLSLAGYLALFSAGVFRWQLEVERSRKERRWQTQQTG
jgi:hypothetical protein